MNDFEAAAKALESRNLKRTLGREVTPAIRASVNLVRRNVRAELKPHNKTGKMRDRVRARITGRGLDTVGGMKSTGTGSNLIVGGVRAHRIPSDGSPVMPLWQGKGKGSGITGFARAVEHPGFGPDPFVHRGIEKSKEGIIAILDQTAHNMVAALAADMER